MPVRRASDTENLSPAEREVAAKLVRDFNRAIAMRRGLTCMVEPIASRVIARIVSDFPEFREEYPMTMIIDEFAEIVWDLVRRGGDEEFLQRAFEFVEELAASGDFDTGNLVTVDFLEAAPGGVHARHRLGPHTRRLVDEITGFDLEGLRGD